MQKLSIRSSGRRLDVPREGQLVFEVLQAGGVALCPNAVGYGIWGGSEASAKNIHAVKQRGAHKRNALLTDAVGQREVHALDAVRQDMIECVTVDYGVPLGVVAPYRADHPLLRNLSVEMLAASTLEGTISILRNGGNLRDEVGRRAREAGLPIFGSSANLTGKGTRFRLEDVPQELRDLADIEVDHGLSRHQLYRRSATIINFTNMSVVRFGSCFELVADILKRHFGVALPADPDPQDPPIRIPAAATSVHASHHLA